MEGVNTNLSYLHFFPYTSFRIDQEGIIKEIEESMRQKNNTLLIAPNGTGKTIIALSAALPVAFEKKLKIIYLCRTHTQNTRVIKELNKISRMVSESGLNIKIRGLSIRGRNEMCLNKMVNELNLPPQESALVCEDLRNNGKCSHYNNLQDNKEILLEDSTLFDKPIDAEEIINLCKKGGLCPYYLCKFLLEKMQIIICNYQWVYNPSIQPFFLMFLGRGLKDCILVQDECHNLIDVATEVNSERIIPYHLANCITDLNYYKGQEIFKKLARSLQKTLNSQREKLKDGETRIDSAYFLSNLINYSFNSFVRKY